MSVSLFEHNAPHGEASRLVAFSTNRLDRRSEHRNESELGEALSDPRTRYFGITQGRLAMRVNGDTPEGLLSAGDLSTLKPEHKNAILIGWDADNAAHIAVPLEMAADDLPDPFKAIDTRSVYRQALLNEETLGAYAQGNSLVAWALANRFCGCCGSAMTPESGGYRRKCQACGHTVFPRTDPVAIMLAVDETRDRCLLGRSPHFPPGMYSCLAGFIEPGETMEDAVRRETLEESGIQIGRVRYHASQPWPMPHSLMIGVYAEAKSLDITRDTNELEDCRWFDRSETEAMLADVLGETDASAPPPGAIAHRLMRDWLDWGR
ncbi:NTP pyrophosphohydrolase [Hoeflea phototrophica DFL-43]|jgi:NAD+ diphosphatase|uniref:NAD(+) diphosphatase n=1 Tax=Hoeflea phototrophica (strain DSM 17068 / NCIMB 14078 / DFL-43) TaxID=411684 RepID=A9CVV3_HOEPD|nr:NAD(+) diphosphatase [Hoeflea phototrophica]EDQ35429.1 NTP pyrophosphohydrolase [Hoeflea phototrophica DFL-43]